MSRQPDDPRLDRLQAYWKLVVVVAAGLLGMAIIVNDALIHPPADPTTSGFGVLLLGIVPVAAADAIRGRSGP